ncbi:peptidase [Paractinoplanes deccanensis]|uniref:Peptidase n=1 Tax=Paractinoplanes deccanensis TaxID=113561 RepID=A0ABQ3Y7B1_9ACTN|nr:alpha/beta hydrolase [Actinoplanes deccanensis]GID75884.1 peptidase [Actinoplanes deccanensis]
MRLTAAVLTVGILLTYVVTPSPSSASASTVTWAACPEDAAVQCGTMRVPADWANPSGPTARLTIARRKATDPARRIGALLVNPGGPGGSAVDFTFNAPAFFGAEVRARFDIVGMDPRGVGRSTPVLCSRELVDAAPSPLIESQRAYDETIAYNRKLAADCAARTGPVFHHVDTASVVRDMEALRAALGEQKISFYGASYGTLIGQEYAERHPARLRALALDSVMDHSADLTGFLTHETDAAENAFHQFIAWCTRDPQCVLRGQDVKRVWATAVGRARAGTLQNPYDPPSKLSVADLIGAAFAAFYEPQWYSFAYYLRDALAAKPAARRAPPPPVDLVDHSFPAVICEDWHLPVSGFPDLRRRLREMAARAPHMLVSPLALSALTGCLGWPSPPDNPQRPLRPLRGTPPVLLVNARHDPATAYSWAARVASALGPRATLLTYQGWGHVIHSRSPCVAGAVDKYLLTVVPPRPGTTCPAVAPQPFGVG